jgi:hypothetical protein
MSKGCPIVADTPGRIRHSHYQFLASYHFCKNINGFQPVFSIIAKSGVNLLGGIDTRQVIWIAALEKFFSTEYRGGLLKRSNDRRE